jgi:Alpha/beta hydrolase of unknown function (DUF900)
MNSAIELLCYCTIRKLASVVVVITFLVSTTERESSAAFPIRDGDSVWEVSSRHLSGACHLGAPLRISKVVGCSFQPSSLEEFIADPVSTKSPQTVVYVHGNWMEWNVARDRGLYVYQLLAAQTNKPIRLILFTWPSERDGRPGPDVREKASLAHVESYYLADFLKNVPSDQSIGMMGYSFGGAVVCGTLQLLGGGSLDNRSLPQPIATLQNIRVSLVAPAFDRDQLKPCGKYSLALGQAERVVNLYNSIDPVLKRFRFIDRGSHEAAGFLGIPLGLGGENRLSTAPNIEQFDCSRAAGRTHSEVEYYRNCPAFKASLQNALGIYKQSIVE